MTDTIHLLKALLRGLHDRLGEATAIASGARDAIEDGNRNLAIGILVDLESLLPHINGLYQSALGTHRYREGPNHG